MREKKVYKGIRTTVIFIPTITLIFISYIAIIISTVSVNFHTKELSGIVEKTTNCTDTVTHIQSSTSKLSETATSFVYTPTIQTPGGKVLNGGPINAYLEEYTSEDLKIDNILKELEKYELDDNIITIINDAANAAKSMQKMQAHAFYLIGSISDVELPERLLTAIDTYELSDEEKALSDDEKNKAAFNILLSQEYSNYKGDVSRYSREVVSQINSQSQEKQNKIDLLLKWLRGILWGSMTVSLIVNGLFFFILLKRLVFKIIKFSKQIDENERLDEGHGLYEANQLASAYNKLLDRHRNFENELKDVAEIDSLTQLPNRYCYNTFLLKPVEEDKSTCVFLLDINNLKYVNDTFGHKAGDDLIKNAAICIKECFLNEEKKNCYRIGGDEFVAILDNIKEDEIDKYITKFKELERMNEVSIAYGYSYSDNVKEVGYEKLIMDADKKMYINKKGVPKLQ